MRSTCLITLFAFSSVFGFGQRTDSYYYQSLFLHQNKIHFSGIIDTSGGGNTDMVFGFVDSLGTPQWAGIIGSVGKEIFNYSYCKDDTLFVIGNTTSYGAGAKDILLIRHDTLGNCKYVVIGESSNDNAQNILVEEGYYKLLGNTEVGVNNYDVVLLELDRNLLPVSKTIYNHSGDDKCSSIMRSKFNNDIILAGKTNFNTGGGDDIFVIKADSNYNVKWARVYYDPDPQELNDIVEDDQGNLYMIGYAKNSWYNGVVIKTDSNGSILWQNRYESTVANKFFRAIMNDQKLYIGGPITTTSGTGDDFLVCKMDTSGEILWSVNMEYNGDQYLTKMWYLDSTLIVSGPTFTSGKWSHQLLEVDTGGAGCNATSISLTKLSTSYLDSVLSISTDTIFFQHSADTGYTVVEDTVFDFETCFFRSPAKDSVDTTGIGVESDFELNDEIAFEIYSNQTIIKNYSNHRIYLSVYSMTGQLLRKASFTGPEYVLFNEWRAPLFVMAGYSNKMKTKKVFFNPVD